MNRRTFTKVVAAGAAGAAFGEQAAPVVAQQSVGAVPRLKVIRNNKIRLGGQRGFGNGPVTSKENMDWHLRWGIKHLDVSLENTLSNGQDITNF